MEPPPPPLSLKSAMELIFRRKAEPAAGQGYISDQKRSKLHRYLQAIDVILESPEDSQGSQAKEAIVMAVARLKHEFLHILTRVTAAQDEESSSSMSLSFSVTISSSMSTGTGNNSSHQNDETSAPLNSISDSTDDLQSIAHRMNSAGHLTEFIEVYTSVRKSFLNRRLRRFGIQKLNTRGLVLDEFKTHIDTWIHASKVFDKSLFPNEHKFSTQIFDRVFGELGFAETVKDAKFQLKNFAEALITSRRSHDKLFKILDLHNPLADICPLLTFTTFLEPTPEDEPILGLCFQLIAVVRETLSDFENALVHEVSPIDEAGGKIHFLTKYVMDYIKNIVDYEYLLSGFIVSNPPTYFGDIMIPDVKFAQDKGKTPLALHLVLIVVVLRFKLEAKSKNYQEDSSLVHLFVINNLHYIVKSIKC